MIERIGPACAFASDGTAYVTLHVEADNTGGALVALSAAIDDYLSGKDGIVEWRLLPVILAVNSNIVSGTTTARCRLAVIPHGTPQMVWDKERLAFVHAEGFFAPEPFEVKP